jgi:N6-adenosine-specific RNA methylase IME4
MREQLERLAGASFPCIAADPAWKYRSWAPSTNPQSDRSVERHYRTMSLDEIKALPIAAVAARDCHLFLWTTGPFLAHSIEIMRSWGFRYSSVAFYWVKMLRRLDGRQLRFIPAADDDFHIGMGFTTRKNVEVCLLGRRGSPKRLSKTVRELIVAPVRQHSRKPDEFYGRVERYAAGPYLDLFSRIERDGWTAIGDQAGQFKLDMQDGQRIEDIALEMAEDNLDSAVARARIADIAAGKEVIVDGVKLSERLAKLEP